TSRGPQSTSRPTSPPSLPARSSLRTVAGTCHNNPVTIEGLRNRARTPDEFAAAVRTNVFQSACALRAESALERADVGFVGWRESFFAPFTFVTNFQGHNLVHSLRADFRRLSCRA